MSNAKSVAEEDLAIQDTLSMTVDERLKLLANLIVEKLINAEVAELEP